MIKKLMLLVTSLLLYGNGHLNQIEKDRLALNRTNDIFELIRDNIDLFNEECKNGDKPRTYYKEATNYYNVLSPYSDEVIGTLIIFDNNQGYITISNDCYVMDSDYECGISLLGSNDEKNTIYYLAHHYSFDKNTLIHNIDSGYRSFETDFHWHADQAWTSEKTRYLQLETDSYYSTLVNTSEATYRNKTTWSTNEITGVSSGSIALANLLWTYKINNVVDLCGDAISSYALSLAIETYTSGGELRYNYQNINSTLLYGTGYYLDFYYGSFTNIDSFLESAPIITLYSSPNDYLYSITTGKGESLYQTILWMNFYTSWSIVNINYDRYSYCNSYIGCKYWIDNQYAVAGCMLKNNGSFVGI